MRIQRLTLNADLILSLSLGGLLFLMALTGAPMAAAQSASDWPQLAGGPTRTGFVSDPTFATLPESEGELQLKWKVALGERAEVTAQPIVADGRVYLGLMDGRVRAFDALTGATLWTKTVGGAVPNTLAYASGRVYFGAEDGIVYALNAANGTETWRYPTGGPVLTAAAVVDGAVYLGSTDGYLYAIDASNGSLHWRFQAAGPVLTSPAVGGGRVYFGAEDADADPAVPYPVAYAVDATTGAVVWSRTLTGLSLRHTYPILDEVSDTVIFRTLHPGRRAYGPEDGWPFQYPCVSQEAEAPANLIAGWNNYYQAYPERRALFFLNARDGQDKPNFPRLPPPPYWGVILPLVDDQHRAWFPTVGACNTSLSHDWRLWRVNLLTGQVEQVATQSQFTLRPDEVGRSALVGDGSHYRYYNTIDADLGVYAPGMGQWYLFGRDGFYNHNYPLDFPPTLHILRYAGAGLAGNVPSPSPPVIANGVLYFTTFGWLYAVEPGGGGHGTLVPPALTPPDPATPPVSEPVSPVPPALGDGSPTAVRAALNAQVAELIAHGPPTPNAKLYGWTLDAIYAYWHPPETLYALARALPYLDEPLHSQTITYLQDQADALLYNPDEYQYQRRCLVYGQLGVQVGDTACGSGIRASWLQNDPNLIAWQLVAMRAIARQTGDWSVVRNNWDFIKGRFYANGTGLGGEFDETLGISVFEDWRVGKRLYLHLQIMATDAVAEMADYAGDTTTRDRALDMQARMFAARLRHGRYVQSLYDSGQLDPLPYPVTADGIFDFSAYFGNQTSILSTLMPYEIEVNRDTDVRQVMWEEVNQTIYEPKGVYRGWAEMYAYRPLDQEIADWLWANLLNETTRYLRTLEFRNPWWFWGGSAHNLMGLGEELYASPHLSFSIFQVEARVMQGDALFGDQPPHDYDWLVQHLPWPYGQPAWRDIYYLQNLIALLEIAGGPDLSASTKTASSPAPHFGQTVTYTVAIRNNGGPFTGTVRLTDTIPNGLSYVSNTVSVEPNIGEPWADATGIRWSGAPVTHNQVTVSYATTVVTTARRVIVNLATVEGANVKPLSLTATTIVNGIPVYLPIMLKDWELTMRMAEGQSALQEERGALPIMLKGWEPTVQTAVRQTAKGRSALQIVDVRPNATTVDRYKKFELTFDVTGTVATNPYFPYDPDPPPGVPPGVGISVDVLFSNDDWATFVVQPAFFYQDYQRDCIGADEENFCQYWNGQEWRSGHEWLYPVGDPVWKIRFAPQETGTWRYRIRATDGSGTTYYPTNGDLFFTVVPSNNHGFLRVSPTDSGYFEFSDGTPFIGVGHGSGFENQRFSYAVDEEMRRFEENRVNFLRIWMTGSSIYMAPWHPWTSHHLPQEGGYFPAASLTYDEAYDDHLFSLRLWDLPAPLVSDRRNPCMFQGFSNNISVKPNTTYRLRVRLKTVGVTGPRDPGYPYGFTVRKAGWLGDTCSDPASTEGQSERLLDHVNGDTEWHEITSSFTTGPDEYFLGNLYLILENTTAGEAFIDQVSLRETDGGVSTGPEVLRKNRFAYHLYFDQQPSWQWDYVFEKAAQSDVTIRPVILEKNDWIANHIDENGNLVGTYYELDNNRFYAKPNTMVRRLHEYFWRYLIARWSYSAAVHSWELMNEGDPFNGNHYAQVNDFGRYMHTHDLHEHPVTTSNWHSFPIAEFWGNPAYSEVDYADLHAYACCGTRYDAWPQRIDHPLSLEEQMDYVYGGKGHSVHIPGAQQFHSAGGTWRSLAIRGEGEWQIRYMTKAENFTGACPYGYPASLAGPRLSWNLDGGPYWGGRSNVVPPAESGQGFICSAPAGTYDWRTFDSQHTADGAEAPLSARLIITDNIIHSLDISFQNDFGSGGEAWIDNVELISPDGERVHLNGQFDLTRIDHDAALLTASYSLRFGGRSPSGPGKPVTRGEVAIGDEEEYLGDHAHDQTNDTQGVWLHNFLWGQINPGGLYELYWDPYNIRKHNLYYHYKAFRDFMDGIPLNNGYYRDAKATASYPDLRVWGQKDVPHGRAHLWIQNKRHTWKNVVDGVFISPISGTVTIPDMQPGPYTVEWWDTFNGTIMRTEVIDGDSALVLTLPHSLSADVAVKVSWAGPDLSRSSKVVSRVTAQQGDILTYTINLINAGASSSVVTLTDTIPSGTGYLAGSAHVSPATGVLNDVAGIRWSGTLSETVVTVAFAVKVEAAEPKVIANRALIDDGFAVLTRGAATIVNGYAAYSPVILRR